MVAAVSFITGLGLGWISTTVFSTPDKVRLAITPATALGWSVAQVVPVGAQGLESALGVVAFGLSVGLAAVLLWRSRRQTMVRNLGNRADRGGRMRAGGVAVVSNLGPRAARRVSGDPAVAGARAGGRRSALVVKADGILAFPLHTAPVFVVLYLDVAVAVWLSARTVIGRSGPVAREPGRSPSPDGDADRGRAGPGARSGGPGPARAGGRGT